MTTEKIQNFECVVKLLTDQKLNFLDGLKRKIKIIRG